MTTIDYATAYVSLDRDVAALPTSVLDAEALRLRAAFDELDAERAAKYDEREAAKRAPADELRAVEEAGRKGTKKPAEQGEAYWSKRVEQLGAEVRNLARRQKAAGDAFEAYVRTSPAIADALARALAEVYAEALEVVAHASALSSRLRALAESARSLAAARAAAQGPTPAESDARRQAVHDAFRDAHRTDKGHTEPGVVATAWSTVRAACEAFPVDAYAVTGVDELVALGAAARRAEALRPKGVQTEEQQRLRRLAATPAVTPPRPTVKSVGQLSAEEVQRVADARRAELPR